MTHFMRDNVFKDFSRKQPKPPIQIYYAIPATASPKSLLSLDVNSLWKYTDSLSKDCRDFYSFLLYSFLEPTFNLSFYFLLDILRSKTRLDSHDQTAIIFKTGSFSLFWDYE